MRAIVPLAVLLAGACTAAHPVSIHYGRTDFGRLGARADVELEANQRCEIRFRELGRLPRAGTLAPADCRELFARAANARLTRAPSCTVTSQFEAGVLVRLSDGATLSACWDDPFTARVAALAERYAPALRRAGPPAGLCDPVDCETGAPWELRDDGGITKDADGCTVETSIECRRRADGGCGREARQTRTCPSR